MSDIEFIQLTPDIDVQAFAGVFESAADLGAMSVTVSGDDRDPARLTAHFAELCELAYSIRPARRSRIHALARDRHAATGPGDRARGRQIERRHSRRRVASHPFRRQGPRFDPDPRRMAAGRANLRRRTRTCPQPRPPSSPRRAKDGCRREKARCRSAIFWRRSPPTPASALRCRCRRLRRGHGSPRPLRRPDACLIAGRAAR